MNRASKEPTASTDKEKHIASTFCLLFRGFQGQQKKGTSEFIEEENIPWTRCWSRKTAGDKMPLTCNPLHEICPKQGTLTTLLTLLCKETFACSQNVEHLGVSHLLWRRCISGHDNREVHAQPHCRICQSGNGGGHFWKGSKNWH